MLFSPFSSCFSPSCPSSFPLLLISTYLSLSSLPLSFTLSFPLKFLSIPFQLFLFCFTSLTIILHLLTLMFLSSPFYSCSLLALPPCPSATGHAPTGTARQVGDYFSTSRWAMGSVCLSGRPRLAASLYDPALASAPFVSQQIFGSHSLLGLK